MANNYLQLLRFYPQVGQFHDCRCEGQSWDKPVFRLVTPIDKMPGFSIKIPRSTAPADRMKDLFACITLLTYPDAQEVTRYKAPETPFRIFSDEDFYYIVTNEHDAFDVLEHNQTYALHVGGADENVGYFSEPFVAIDCDCLTRIEMGNTVPMGDIPYQTNFFQVFYTHEKLCDAEPEIVLQKSGDSAGSKTTYQRQTRFKRLDLVSVPDYVVDILSALPMHSTVKVSTPFSSFEVIPGRSEVSTQADNCCYSDVTLKLAERETELKAAAGCDDGTGIDLTEQIGVNNAVCTNADIWTPADLAILDGGEPVTPSLPTLPSQPAPVPEAGSLLTQLVDQHDCLDPFWFDGIPYIKKFTQTFADGAGGTYPAVSYEGQCQGSGGDPGDEPEQPEVDTTVKFDDVILRVGQQIQAELVPVGTFRAVLGQTLTVSATANIPPGMTFDGVNLNGNPTVEGTYDVKILATLSGGGKTVIRRSVQVLPSGGESEAIKDIGFDYDLDEEEIVMSITSSLPVEVKAIADSKQRLGNGGVFYQAVKVANKTDGYTWTFGGAGPGRYSFHVKVLGESGEGIIIRLLLTKSASMKQDLQTVTGNGNTTNLPIFADFFGSKTVETLPDAELVAVWKQDGNTFIPGKMLKSQFLGAGNRPPELVVPVSPKTAKRGENIIIAVPKTTFTDKDNDTIGLTASGMPAGMVWNSVDWQLEGSPTEVGTFSIILTANDGHGGITQHAFSLSVEDEDIENTPPVANSISSIPGKTGTVLSFVAQQSWFTDADGFAVFFDLSDSQIPPGLSRITDSGKTVGFTGIPTQAGTFIIPVKASDFGEPSLSATANVTVVITTDAGPLVLQSPTWDGATGALSMVSSGGNGSVVEYEIVTPNIRQWGTSPNFTVPTQWRNGTQLTLEARQSGVVVTRQFTTYNNSGNQPPVINNAPVAQSNVAGTVFAYTLPANTAVDPEAGVVTYNPQDLPAWLTFDPSTRVFGGTSPLSAANTNLAITIKCSDPQGLFVNTVLNITVTQPTAPVSSVVSRKVYIDWDAGNTTANIQLGDFVDANAGPVLVEIVGQDGTVLNGNNFGTSPWQSGTYSPTYTFTSDPDYTLYARFYRWINPGYPAQTGVPAIPIFIHIKQGAVVQTLAYDVADGSGEVTTTSNTNRKPVPDVPILYIPWTAGQPLEAIEPFFFGPNRFKDPDGDALTKQMKLLTGGNFSEASGFYTTLHAGGTEAALPGWATFNTATGQLSGTPPASGTPYTIGFRLIATDPGSLSAHQDWQLILAATPDAPDNEGDPVSYFQGELIGLRVTPRPPEATGEAAKNINWGFADYTLNNYNEGTPERTQRAYFVLVRNRVAGRCKVGHFLVLGWNDYEKTLGAFNEQIDNWYNASLEKFRLAGELVYLGIRTSRGDGRETSTAFISDSEAQKWPDGSNTFSKTHAVQARYDIDYELLKTGYGWMANTSTVTGRIYNYIKTFCTRRKSFWLNGVIQGVSILTSTTDETAFTRDFFNGVMLFTDFSTEMKNSYRAMWGFDSSVPYPLSNSNPREGFNSQNGRLAAYHRTHLLAVRFAVGCMAVYDVMPGVPLIPDYGGWYHDEAAGVGTEDPHLFFEIVVNEYLRPRYPTTTIRFIIKQNPFPKDNAKAAGAMTGGIQFWIADQNTHFYWGVQDQDYINMQNGKIYDLNASELAVKNIEFLRAARGKWGSFMHGTVGSPFDLALAMFDAYCSTPNRVSGAVADDQNYGTIYHSPEQFYQNDGEYRNRLFNDAQAASNNWTRGLMVKREARILYIDVKQVGSQRTALITMPHIITGRGTPQIQINNVWVDINFVESFYVAKVDIPNGVTEVLFRPLYNQVATVRLTSDKLTGLTSSYVRKYWAFKSQL